MTLQPQRLCADLSIAEQQMLEIAKGLMGDARVFIFDEPTAPLNRAEIDKLGAVLAELKRTGKLVFYISHRLEEIFRFCDTVSVLKDGQHVTTQPATALSEARLVQLMVGREIAALFPTRGAPADTAPLLDVAALSPRGSRAQVSLSLGQGEIVGIAGLEGHGQREILRAIAGVEPLLKSDMRVADAGRVLRRFDPSLGAEAAVAHGVALMPEDRKSEGLYLDLAVQDNLWLGTMRGAALWHRADRDPSLVRQWAEKLRLRGRPADPVRSLSDGNQQKVMLGRWLLSGVRILLVEQPTRGVDVGAKAEMYKLLQQFVDQGGAVLVVSGDIPELIGLCNRILVVRDGALVVDVPAETATEERLLGLALRDPAELGQHEIAGGCDETGS